MVRRKPFPLVAARSSFTLALALTVLAAMTAAHEQTEYTGDDWETRESIRKLRGESPTEDPEVRTSPRRLHNNAWEEDANPDQIQKIVDAYKGVKLRDLAEERPRLPVGAPSADATAATLKGNSSISDNVGAAIVLVVAGAVLSSVFLTYSWLRVRVGPFRRPKLQFIVMAWLAFFGAWVLYVLCSNGVPERRVTVIQLGALISTVAAIVATFGLDNVAPTFFEKGNASSGREPDPNPNYRDVHLHSGMSEEEVRATTRQAIRDLMDDPYDK